MSDSKLGQWQLGIVPDDQLRELAYTYTGRRFMVARKAGEVLGMSLYVSDDMPRDEVRLYDEHSRKCVGRIINIGTR